MLALSSLDSLPPWTGLASALTVVVVAWFAALGFLCRKEQAPHIASIAKSRLPCLSTRALCCIRSVLAMYIIVSAVHSLCFLVPAEDNKEVWLFYYTAWNWCILGLYFVLASLASFMWLRKPEMSLWESSDGSPTHGRLTRACSTLCSLNASNILMVDVAVWFVLYPTSDTAGRQAYLSFESLNHHAINFFFMLFELVVADVPVCKQHVAVVILFVATYGAFTILRVVSVADTTSCVVEHCDKFVNGFLVWPYFFLDTSPRLAGVYYMGLLGAEALFFELSSLGRRALARCFVKKSADLLCTEA